MGRPCRERETLPLELCDDPVAPPVDPILVESARTRPGAELDERLLRLAHEAGREAS